MKGPPFPLLADSAWLSFLGSTPDAGRLLVIGKYRQECLDSWTSNAARTQVATGATGPPANEGRAGRLPVERRHLLVVTAAGSVE